MFRILNLKKQFPQGFTLRADNFLIEGGEITAFLGANGSGKSTLFDLLTGNSDPSEGDIYWSEERMSPDKFLLKRQIGYLPQNLPLPKWVTAQELLTYAAILHELDKPSERAKEAMKYWDCISYKSKPLATCSFGMQKRVGLALATLHNPPCLILDEPFSGLDLFHIRTLENVLAERRKEAKTTIISTHILPYVVRSCARVFIIDQGQVKELPEWPQQNAEEKTRGIEKHFFS